jgi:hypothetical protein
VFVGRQAELHQLKFAFEAAATGQGALMLLVGGPGIGKTALRDQLGGSSRPPVECHGWVIAPRRARSDALIRSSRRSEPTCKGPTSTH